MLAWIWTPTGRPPEMWAYDWWTEAGIPGLGVIGGLLTAVGTIAVSVIAVCQSRRALDAERADRARSRRGEFIPAVDAYLASRGSHTDDWRAGQRVEGALHAAAITSGADKAGVEAWVVETVRRLVEMEEAPYGGDDHTHHGPPITEMAHEQGVRAGVRMWVETGTFDAGSVDLLG
ncbi:hypothetical protein [Microbacterium sp. zg.Y909]|uniref:hypothetical protein n=1 Tax=Microbacterium sp. zg.Y909 TaxID=2969413 RepID=UPI00214AE5B9|nr:hypothetical protein [Microbacterium sp. zg.Y909]MCR2824945.1 hypothetical protein [Microbacterium sp. zg.Y909]